MVRFFGYGAYFEKKRVVHVINRPPDGGYPALLVDYVLAVQTVDQIEKIAGGQLKKGWGNDFKCYTVKKGKGLVLGRVWEITEEELKILKEWEYDGTWRQFKEVHVVLGNQSIVSAITDMVYPTARISKIVNGLDYDPTLNKSGHQKRENEEEIMKKMRQIRAQITSE